MSEQTCHHLQGIAWIRTAEKRECEDCIRIGGKWVHLRTCQSCGATHCCDQSPHQHARKHARVSAHHVIASAEPGERWLYCFEDDAFLEY